MHVNPEIGLIQLWGVGSQMAVSLQSEETPSMRYQWFGYGVPAALVISPYAVYFVSACDLIFLPSCLHPHSYSLPPSPVCWLLALWLASGKYPVLYSFRTRSVLDLFAPTSLMALGLLQGLLEGAGGSNLLQCWPCLCPNTSVLLALYPSDRAVWALLCSILCVMIFSNLKISD